MVRAAIAPREADPPLVVDPNAVLTFAISPESLEPIAWRDPQILDIARSMEDLQFAQGRPLERAINASHELLVPDPLGVLVPKRPDHTSRV